MTCVGCSTEVLVLAKGVRRASRWTSQLSSRGNSVQFDTRDCPSLIASRQGRFVLDKSWQSEEVMNSVRRCSDARVATKKLLDRCAYAH